MQPSEDRQARPAGRGRGAWVRAILVFAAVLAIDQASKRLIEHSIVQGEERHLLPGIQLVDTRNDGVAFGLFPKSPAIVTTLIILALLGLLAYFAKHSERGLIWLPTGMLVGGALGNILDRVRDGSVTDFIKLPLGWPPFNLADSSIVVGIAILFVLLERPRGSGP